MSANALLTWQFTLMNPEVEVTRFNAKRTVCQHHVNICCAEYAGMFWKWIFWCQEKCGCVCQGSGHLVSRHSELLKLNVKLWVASWGGGKLGLSSGLTAAMKTHTCDSNYYLHKDLSLCKSQTEREARLKCHLSPFGWCRTMALFAKTGPSPTGEEVWFTDFCSWLWLLCVRLPLPQSTVLCGQKSKTPKDQQHVKWVMFCFSRQPSTK